MAKQPRRNTSLWRARVQHYLTQSQLAEIADVTSKTVQRWERGTSTPRAYSLHKLCAFFQVTPAELGFPDSSGEEEREEGQESIYEAEDRVTRSCGPSTYLFLLIAGCIILAIVIISLRPS